MYQETYYFSFNAIGIPFPVKNIEELIYGTNEMFSVLNLLIKMFAKLSRIKIMLFGNENESILMVN